MKNLEELGLTKEDAATSRWNILEYLTNEEEITAYLQGVILDINEEDCEPAFFFIALADVAKARTINQLVKDAGIDRKTLCDIFLDNPKESQPLNINHDVIAKAAQSFAVP